MIAYPIIRAENGNLPLVSLIICLHWQTTSAKERSHLLVHLCVYLDSGLHLSRCLVLISIRLHVGTMRFNVMYKNEPFSNKLLLHVKDSNR